MPDKTVYDVWEDWANVYVRYSANLRLLGRGDSRSVGEDAVVAKGEVVPMYSDESVLDVREPKLPITRQGVQYRVRALEDQARRMAYMCARSATLRELFLAEFASWSDEPWFETYDGVPLESVGAVVEQLTGRDRAAYP